MESDSITEESTWIIFHFFSNFPLHGIICATIIILKKLNRDRSKLFFVCWQQDSNIHIIGAFNKYVCILMTYWGHEVVQGLKHCASSRKVAGSIPDVVTGIFHWYNPFGPEIDSASKKNEYQECILGSKGGWGVGLTTLPISCVDCLEIWERNLGACTSIVLPL